MHQDYGYDTSIYIIICLAIILGAVVLNWTIVFYVLWTKLQAECIRIRRPKSVLLFGALCTLALLIRNPLQFAFSLTPNIFYGMFWFQYILLHATTVGFAYILIYRTWMVYFDIKWVNALKANEWQREINTKTLKPSWYIQKRQTFGNPKYVTVCLLLTWSFFCIFGTISTFSAASQISLLFVLVSLLLAIPILGILSCKMPKYNDYYCIRKETQILSILYCTLVIAMFILTWIIGSPIGSLNYIYLQILHIGIIFVLAFVSFYWVFGKFAMPKWLCAIRSFQDIIMLQSTQNMNNSHVQFTHVFQSNEQFSSFANHLSSQFAIENILFFVETYQFIRYLKGILDEKDTLTVTTNAINDLQITANVPQSTIVTELKEQIQNGKLDKNDCIRVAAVQLFLKYIEDNAYFVINISFETRHDLSSKFNVSPQGKSNVSSQQIYTAFDNARLEIWYLLNGSFVQWHR